MYPPYVQNPVIVPKPRLWLSSRFGYTICSLSRSMYMLPSAFYELLRSLPKIRKPSETARDFRLAVLTISLQLCKLNKRSILILHSISYVGILQVYPRLPYNNQPKHPTTMVSQLPPWLRGCSESANPTP